MMRTKSAGGVVLNAKDEVLVVNQNGNSWSLPKGRVDEGEDLLAAARREIFEESEITDLTLIRELGSYSRYKIGLDGSDDRSEFKTITVFLFRTRQHRLSPTDPHIAEARWVSKDKVAGMLTHRKDKEFFASILKEL